MERRDEKEESTPQKKEEHDVKLEQMEQLLAANRKERSRRNESSRERERVEAQTNISKEDAKRNQMFETVHNTRPGVVISSADKDKKPSKKEPEKIKKEIWESLQDKLGGTDNLTHTLDKDETKTFFHYKETDRDNELHINLKDPLFPKVTGNPNSDGLAAVLESVFEYAELEVTLDFSGDAFKGMDKEAIEARAKEVFAEIYDNCEDVCHLTSFKYHYKGEHGRTVRCKLDYDDLDLDISQYGRPGL